MRSPDDSIRPIDQVVTQLHQRLGLARPDVFAQVQQHWSSIVGGSVASRCQPSSIRGGELVVVTADPATAEQLRWTAADLVAAVTAVLGEDAVERVVVKVDPQLSLS